MLGKTYDIGDWLDWQRTPQGSTNISFFVTASSGRYVLRCSTARKSLDAMRFEVSSSSTCASEAIRLRRSFQRGGGGLR